MDETDPIEKCIGRFGKYQIWILALLTFSRFPTDIQMTNVVFLIPDVKYICLDNASEAVNICPCNDPLYDQTTIKSSVTSTWNLICERKYLSSLAQSIVQAGILAGSMFYGYFSDRYGRRLAVSLSFFMAPATIALSALVPQFWMFMVCRFFIGTGLGGTMLCCYVLLIELSGPSFRAYSAGLNEIAHNLGYIILPMIAYFVRDWRHLQLVTSVPWLVSIFCYWFLPESPRWLITVGKKDEAVNQLTKIASVNNMATDHIASTIENMQTKGNSNSHRTSFLDLFKTSKIRKYTIVMALVWLCCAHTFFGVNQFIGRLNGNVYLNVLASAAFLIPGLLLCVFSTVILKRRTSVIISFLTAAVSLVLLGVIPKDDDIIILGLAIIGQVGAYSAFVQIYLFSSEVFPTEVRNSAMGFASVFARFGAFVAPFVVNIGVVWVSSTVFSAVALCAAVLCWFLPETKEVVLLNTIKQTEESYI